MLPAAGTGEPGRAHTSYSEARKAGKPLRRHSTSECSIPLPHCSRAPLYAGAAAVQASYLQPSQAIKGGHPSALIVACAARLPGSSDCRHVGENRAIWWAGQVATVA